MEFNEFAGIVGELREAQNKPHRNYIDSMYDSIIKDLRGSTLLGKELDENDPKQVAIAAYYYGMQKHGIM